MVRAIYTGWSRVSLILYTNYTWRRRKLALQGDTDYAGRRVINQAQDIASGLVEKLTAK